MFYGELDSPLGKILLESDGEFLTGVRIGIQPPTGAAFRDDLPVFAQAKDWLQAYFAGMPRPVGELPLKPEGTPFQQMVWAYLAAGPWGQTCTYGQIAREIAPRLGREKMSAQAVGQAVGRNRIWFIIPCHRCVGAGGKLTGYAGGLDKKAWLLRHEEVEI